jgi:hypothetical protein
LPAGRAAFAFLPQAPKASESGPSESLKAVSAAGDGRVVDWSDTTAGVAGASGSIIGGAAAVIAVAITINGGGPRWRAGGAAGPQERPLVIHAPPVHVRRRHDARERPVAVPVTAPVPLAPRPAGIRPVAARVVRVRAVVHRRRVRKTHRVVAAAPVSAPAPAVVPVAAPAVPAPAPAEHKLPPGRTKPKHVKVHGRKAETVAAATATPAVVAPPGHVKHPKHKPGRIGQTPRDEAADPLRGAGDGGDAARAEHRGHRRHP